MTAWIGTKTAAGILGCHRNTVIRVAERYDLTRRKAGPFPTSRWRFLRHEIETMAQVYDAEQARHAANNPGWTDELHPYFRWCRERGLQAAGKGDTARLMSDIRRYAREKKQR